ncbi:MAG: PSD1 domain-containing protein [Acidobacteriota bacterium]|nr:MAG: PSD1 domain-containing protein [Acidobacteriota bacterium]
MKEAFRLGPASLRLVVLACVLMAGACTSDQSDANLPETVRFNEHIRPILSNKCFACHGPDSGTREAGLRLDQRESATAERAGYDYPAIIPGSSGRSVLIERISEDDPARRMPPPPREGAADPSKALSVSEIALLEEWIDQGAEWEGHWAYERLRRPAVPDVQTETEPKSKVDSFILARLKEAGLGFSNPAEDPALFRRLHLDLTGLPPTLHDLDQLAEEGLEATYAAWVERLLDSPRYGERMAIWWLDLVRYADTNGYHSDVHRRIWPYRDYVINAFNENKPFDQFTREQIAGDLLPNRSREQLVASGFNRLGQITKEGGAQPKEYLAKYAADRVRTVGTAWLGSTIGCAECHDHKFDPFSMEDFYGMAAFFADIKEKGVYENDGDVYPELTLASLEPEKAMRQNSRMDELQDRLLLMRRLGRPETVSREEWAEQVRSLEEAIDSTAPRTLVSVAVEPRPIRILPRGNWQSDAGPRVAPVTPAFLGGTGQISGIASRLDLADWLVSSKNPVTARVFVNRLWKLFFGVGLSRTLDDLGSQGSWPTHPDLLDWLAVEFIESGWDVKHVVRQIVLSETYRQTSVPTEESLREDPDNSKYSRQNRFRVSSEMVRDIILATSGLLSERIGGPSVQPYQPADYWKEINTFGVEGPGSKWVDSNAEDQYRRGLYTYWKRSFLHPSLMAFDAPSRQECSADRPISNTPVQALALLNDPSYVEAARVLAAQLLLAQELSDQERIDLAYRRALSRQPRDQETAKLMELLESQLTRFQGDEQAAFELLRVGNRPIPREVEVTTLAAWTTVGRAILNLHEIVTRY